MLEIKPRGPGNSLLGCYNHLKFTPYGAKRPLEAYLDVKCSQEAKMSASSGKDVHGRYYIESHMFTPTDGKSSDIGHRIELPTGVSLRACLDGTLINQAETPVALIDSIGILKLSFDRKIIEYKVVSKLPEKNSRKFC